VNDTFERVVAENRQLRKELKTLRARVAAVESSRWWRLHPRSLLRRLRSPSANGDSGAFDSPAKVKRVAQSWKLKAAHDRRNAGRAADEIVVRDGIRLKVHPDTRGSFEELCYTSPEQVEELDVFIANTGDRQRLLDVGALHGIFSLVFAVNDRDKRALAVDASPVPFAKLLYNIHRNRAENITAVECALSAEPGALEMHYTSELAVAGAASDGGVTVPVEKDTGDRLCERYSFEPDVVKIDVEGHELRVLQGLRQTLRRNRPLLFLEVHPWHMAADAGNGTLAELVEELRTLGYPEVDEIAHLNEIARLLLRPE
jgi:FkbM family methyltransferase